jgi:hypothetical protein
MASNPFYLGAENMVSTDQNLTCATLTTTGSLYDGDFSTTIPLYEQSFTRSCALSWVGAGRLDDGTGYQTSGNAHVTCDFVRVGNTKTMHLHDLRFAVDTLAISNLTLTINTPTTNFDLVDPLAVQTTMWVGYSAGSIVNFYPLMIKTSSANTFLIQILALTNPYSYSGWATGSYFGWPATVITYV